jgi:ABC-type lipoprotein export system ATPase subunit
MSEDPFILCDNLVKIYKTSNLEVVALQGLDLTVTRGELLGIVGASGSGKTTLMNILGGLERPSAGRVWVDGQNLLKLSDANLDRYRSTKVGFIWQQSARNLVPYLTALQNVELPIILAGRSGRGRRKRAESLLDLVGLLDRRHHYLHQLSGGEQQRVAIAVAVANDPKLLLGDEPTGEVDSTTALTLYQVFRDLNRSLGLTTVIVSHDTEIAYRVDRVVAIRDGKTSTETTRRNHTDSEAPAESAADGASDSGAKFDELVVLDSAGRLQLPKEYLEHLNIKGRARVELGEDAILIKQAPETAAATSARTPVAELIPTAKPGAMGRWWRKLRRVDPPGRER